MSDNITLIGGYVVATEDVGGVHYQRTKLTDPSSGQSGGIGIPSNPLSVVGTLSEVSSINQYLGAATVPGYSLYKSPPPRPAWQAILTGTSGALSATVNVYASNDQVHDTLVGTITLSVANWLSSADDDVVELIPGSFGSWGYVRHELSAISGTGASVTTMGG